MKQYCYVIVRMDVTRCTTKILAQSARNGEPTKWDEYTLQNLLHKGWQPVREMSMGHGHALILLEKDRSAAAAASAEAVAAPSAQES